MQAVDVVVVGAGLAGLTAARALSENFDVQVLEARDRVGGRTAGHTFANGCTVEMGAAWVGRTHTELLRLIDELGLETFPTYDDGQGLTFSTGERLRWTDDSLGLPEASNAEIVRLHREIDELARRVDVDAPWHTPNAEEMDYQTVESWLAGVTDDPIARAYVRFLTLAVFAAEAYEVPWLHFLFYVSSGGSLEYLISTTDGAQESRVVGGTHRICERLAEGLPPGSVELRTPVHGITQDENAVRVAHERGVTMARRVIVTLPPALAVRLSYGPPMPPARDALTQRFPMGRVIKVQAQYSEPFWRADGLSGQVVSFEDAIGMTFDNSPPDGSCGVLMGFAEGDHARRLGALDSAERRSVVIGSLERFFGPKARNIRDFAELDWSAEQYTRGCYGGRPAAGVWTSYGHALREPAGRIHWAGAETSPTSNGYMDGAVRSGLRVSAEVAASF